jgi:hypothetical protein
VINSSCDFFSNYSSHRTTDKSKIHTANHQFFSLWFSNPVRTASLSLVFPSHLSICIFFCVHKMQRIFRGHVLSSSTNSLLSTKFENIQYSNSEHENHLGLTNKLRASSSASIIFPVEICTKVLLNVHFVFGSSSNPFSFLLNQALINYKFWIINYSIEFKIYNSNLKFIKYSHYLNLQMLALILYWKWFHFHATIFLDRNVFIRTSVPSLVPIWV